MRPHLREMQCRRDGIFVRMKEVAVNSSYSIYYARCSKINVSQNQSDEGEVSV